MKLLRFTHYLIAITALAAPLHAGEIANAANGAQSRPSMPAKAAGVGDDAIARALAASAAAKNQPRAILYEEGVAKAQPIAIDGTIQWSLADGPIAQARIDYPEKGLSAILTFRKSVQIPNTAYVVEVAFRRDAQFASGEIASVLRLALKPDEKTRGDAILAVPAKIDADTHVIGLGNSAKALKTNGRLLRNRDWIDMPITYSTGQRALMTLAISPIGHKAIAAVLNSGK